MDQERRGQETLQGKPMEYHEKLWDTTQDGRVLAGIYVGFECAVVDGNETSGWFMIKSGVKQVCDVGIPILTVLGFGHEKGNSKQEKKDKVEFHNSGP